MNQYRRAIIFALILCITSQACTLSLLQFPSITGGDNGTGTPVVISGATATPQPKAQTTFMVTLPEPLAPGETLLLAVLDEVTGLPFNPTYYPMQASNAQTYSAVLPLTLNSHVKYRYMRQSGSLINEDLTNGISVRYRMYYVSGQGEVRDIINDWGDKNYSRPNGIVNGMVLNADTGTPVPNLLITLGGAQTVTNSSGQFTLNGLADGTHNIVVYAMDGSYQTFQQGTTVAQGFNTSFEVRVRAAPMVGVTFLVRAPSDTVPGAPIRLAGNILQLGNTFADLQGGANTSPDRMPVMNLTADGRYSLTINLPASAYIQYKYTLGDGFWNSEHSNEGGFILREFVVPAQSFTIEDNIQSWKAGASSPILFEVNVPSVTPPGDIVYIQFNPYGWMEPIPMWPLGNNQWAYKLYGPFLSAGSIHYRYCRNAQCNSADDLTTQGNSSRGREISTSLLSQDIKDTVNAWAWYENPEATAIVGASIIPRIGGFVSGVEFQPGFHPSWSAYMPHAFVYIQAIGANQVVIPATWTYKNTSPIDFGPVPGSDPMWIDTAIMVSQARALNLQVALFPTPRFPASGGSSSSFWNSAPKDGLWWQTWFDSYRAFAIHYADLATQSGSQTLILGGDWITPAMPNGVLADGASSGVPVDAEARWKAIITDVRAHFKGSVLWAMPYVPAKPQTALEFIKNTDGVYLLWSAPISAAQNPSKDELITEISRLLDNEISPIPSITGKPIIIALNYASINGAARGCAIDCLEFSTLSRPNPDNPSVALDLQAQATIYEAMFTAINARPWISGVVSRGYYPPAALQDKSTSIHGKPAADIAWYWFPRFTGAIK